MQKPQNAIDAALNSKWDNAIRANLSILKDEPKNINALNRLGFAYLNKGLLRKAKSAFNKTIKIDPFNPIALKNLKKIKSFSAKITINNYISPKIFIEEPGITKTASLVYLANKTILSTLCCGQSVNIIPKKNRVEIRSLDNTYLGSLPDDLSYRLKKLIKLGNEYCAYAKTIDETHLTIIIREIKRSKKVKDASFTVKLLPDYHTSIRSEILEELLEDKSETSSSNPEEAEAEE